MVEAAGIPARSNPLDGRLAAGPDVQVMHAAPAIRTSLRVPEKSVSAVSKALGLTLPGKPKSSFAKGTRAALWLGPDEWLVLDEGDADPIGSLVKTRVPHCAVDISHRNTAITVTGANAEAALAAGCPQNLGAKSFPVGACSRTVLGKAEVVLWRTDAKEFRIECWRSFSTYVFDFLELAVRDAGA